MWTNRLRKSRHDRVTAGSQQSIKTQGDCLHLKDTKYHYNKHERAHPSHCRLLFCQHCFALQTIILPQWFDLRRSKTEWTKETMKREEVTVCEKEREEDKKRNKQRTQMKTSAENTTERPPERPPNDPPNDPWFMSCQSQGRITMAHQGRRITMAQPLSSIIRDLVKSSRSIAHSDDFEGHKLIQTNSRQLILLDLNILYWCPASRDQIKPLLVQPQISCNANGLAVANPIGRAMI